MNAIQVRPLGDVAEFFSGFAWKANRFSEDSDGLPIIRIQNVGDDASIEFKYWPDDYSDRFIIRKGDLLLTLSGSFRAVVWRGPDALLNQRIVKVSPKGGTDTRWLFYALENTMSRIAGMGRHALVSNVALSDLKELKISVPPLDEQRRIAGILDQADALRRLRARALEKLNTLGQAIFHEMFGETSRPSQRILSQNFIRCSLGDQITLQRGKDITKKQADKGEIPVISSGGISFYHDTAYVTGPGVLLGRKGSVGKVHYSPTDYWPHDTTL